MRNLRLGKSIRNILIYLSLISFIPILGLEEASELKIFALLRILCCFSALLHYVTRRKTSLLILIIVIFVMWLECITCFYRGIHFKALYGDLIVISACMFFEYQIKKNQLEFLQKLYKYCVVTISLNLLSILLVPEGLFFEDPLDVGVHFLLGNYNLFIVHILPAVCAGYHLMVKGEISKKEYIYLWIVVIVTYLLRTSMTSVIGLLVLGVFLLFFNKKVWRIVFNPVIYVISTTIMVYMLVFARTGNVLSYISSITGKSITLSGRTQIWSSMIAFLSNHWIIGYGMQDRSELIEMLDLYHAHHAHNLILQVIWQSGFTGSFLLGVVVLILVYRLLRTSNNKIGRYYGCAFFVLLIISIADFYEYRVIFSMIVIFNGCCAPIRGLQKQTNGKMLGEIL